MPTLGYVIGEDSANKSNWENNKRIPGEKFIIALIKITADYLIKVKLEEKTNFTESSSFSAETRELHFFKFSLRRSTLDPSLCWILQ